MNNNTPYTQYSMQNFTPGAVSYGDMNLGRGRGAGPSGTTASAKKSRKPTRGNSAGTSPYISPQDLGPTPSGSGGGIAGSPVGVQWSTPITPSAGPSSPVNQGAGKADGLVSLPGPMTPTAQETGTMVSLVRLPTQRGGSLISARAPEDDVEGEDDLLPDMEDEVYSAQLSWQSQSKDNLKVLMDNFSPEQYDRYEAYRRNALPKQAVRRVIQQTLGQQVSTPVAQVVAGFAKVFVGDMVEKAREVQRRRGESGPLSPDHLREAYQIYQTETGAVAVARPNRGKKLFVR